MASEKLYYATGKRKTSAARVFLRPGNGKMTINSKPVDEYLKTPAGKVVIEQPFHVTDTKGRFDTFITVSGGGVTGQTEAIRHGIARALLGFDPEMRKSLKKAGFLTRDDRMVERKKYGRHKARRSSQFSKR